MIETERQEEVLRSAHNLFVHKPHWVVFYREILGVHGAVRRNFPIPEDLTEFEQSEAYHEIQHMLRKLRERVVDPGTPQEPVHMITVRIPVSLHDALRNEASERKTSMNKLCISKLLQFIDSNLVPVERWVAHVKRREE